VYYLRDDDIPRYVADGVADIGIVGENVVAEKEVPVTCIEKLGFGECRLSIAVPRGSTFESIAELSGKSIATSYPGILSRYLQEQGVSARIHEISGSVEIAPGIGLSDAICDLVSSGSTLLMNGLREVQTIFRSEAVLIARQDLSDELQHLVDDLLFRIRSVKRARSTKYIVLNAPNDSLPVIQALLPGVKSPSILPLAKSGWSSLHSVVNENEFWDVIEKVREAGAQGILVLPIEKVIDG
jgi:ATP phosphoribosyltransferase